jgi:hypothetical protein
MAKKKDLAVILYDTYGKPLAPSKQASGLYMNPNDYRNYGKYRPQYYSQALNDTEQTVNYSDRQRMVSISRQLFARMPEVTSASKQKASWVVNGGFLPVYNGNNKSWGEAVTKWLVNSWFPACSNKGLAYDWFAVLRLISKMMDKDGDTLMLPIVTKNGFPKLQFVATHRIQSRASDTVQSGKYAGYPIKDGVIYNPNGSPVAYNITTDDDESNDTIISCSNAYLIFDPEFFDKGRGIPIISSALGDALDLEELRFFIKQTVKQQQMLNYVVTNEMGQAEDESVSNSWAQANNPDPTTPVRLSPFVEEVTEAGIKYLKTGSKLEPLKTDTPASSVQDFTKEISKLVMQAMGWPHELILSPDKIGGAAARGIAEMVRKTIQERQSVIEKFAKVALTFAISTAMENGIIPRNYDEDFTDWHFTKGAQLVLDAGNERAADLNDYRMGIKSLNELTLKYGKGFLQVREQISVEADDLLTRAEALQAKHPKINISTCLDIVSQRSVNPLPPQGEEPEPMPEPVLAN